MYSFLWLMHAVCLPIKKKKKVPSTPFIFPLFFMKSPLGPRKKKFSPSTLFVVFGASFCWLKILLFSFCVGSVVVGKEAFLFDFP